MSLHFLGAEEYAKSDVRETVVSARTDSTIHLLDRAVRTPAVATHVAAVLERLARALPVKPGQMAWDTIPLGLFDQPLPPAIASCWVFVIRAGAETGAERHPNSHQRSLSLLGHGEFQLWDGRRWEPYPLVSDPGAPVDRRWVTIPPNTWHRLFVGPSDWGMLSFHTVAAEELIEERPSSTDSLDGGPTERLRYLQ